MNKNEKMNLVEKILQTCLFSEYLPSEFSTELLNKDVFTFRKSKNNIQPVIFTMDKFNELQNRRFISIPDVCSFINACQSFLEGNILNQIIKLNKRDSHSLSKILTENLEVKTFHDSYNFNFEFIVTNDVSKIDIDNDFLENLNLKLEKSSSCKYILHLDIANFYNSIYTHNITALTKGGVWATKQFQAQMAGNKTLKEYDALANIDEKIRGMNLKRTHGLLIGPRLSFIIAESLLTRIDFELEETLSRHNIDFVRYVDDYDVFIKKDEHIKLVKDTFNQVLQKYGLFLNDSKTKIEEFPFYTYIDYKTIVEKTLDLSRQYAEFAQIEKNRIQNGALLYFCKNVLSTHKDSKLALSISFSLLKNISKALVSSCKNIANFDVGDNSKLISSSLIDILEDFTNQKCDLECVWVLYTLLKLFPQISIEEYPLFHELNEIALVVYMYESTNRINEKFLKERAKKSGWLLNYELYFNDIITEEEFKNNLKITNISSYQNFKTMGIHFYIKKQDI